MERRDMTIQFLKYILAVAEICSITEAARQRHISRPSLSAAMRDVEKEARTAIFNRCRAGSPSDASFPMDRAICPAGKTW